MASTQGESIDVQQELKLIESDIPDAELPKPAELLCYSLFIQCFQGHCLSSLLCYKLWL